MSVREPAEVEAGLQRLEAFSDGVLAVIITITAFELKPPAAPTAAALGARLPELLVYALSFVVVGIYWNNHHHLLRSATHLSGRVMWSNFLLLFWLSLIPVLTTWIGSDYESSLPAAAYGANAFLAAASYYNLVRALIAANPQSRLAESIARDIKGLISLVLYAAAVAGAFVTPWLAYALFVAVGLIWFVPDRRLARA
jgi:TMEM175 potassium channel family protein